MQRDIINSITILLCECDSLSEDGTNIIITEIFNCFVTHFMWIRNEVSTGILPEKHLLGAYKKFFNAMRAFFGSVYRTGQYKVLLHMYLYQELIDMMYRDINDVYKGPFTLQTKILYLKSVLGFFMMATFNN